MGDLAVIHCLLEQFFLQYYVYLQKKLVSAMRSFRGTMIISKEYSLPSILSTCTVYFSDVKICSHPHLLTDFLSVYFRRPVAVKQTSYQSSYIFRAASIILKWEQPLEAVTFSQKYLFKTPSCLEELPLSWLLLCSKYFSWYKYFFSTATVMFRRSYFLRISNYSKHVLFRSKRFFRTATFSEE